MPNNFLKNHEYTIKTSTLPNSGFGAFTNIYLPKDTILDYYRGKTLSPKQYTNLEDKSYIWRLKTKDRGEFYVDGQDKSKSNWLRYLNDARSNYNNIKPYQYDGKIFYKTMEDIQPGQELFVNYGGSYW